MKKFRSLFLLFSLVYCHKSMAISGNDCFCGWSFYGDTLFWTARSYDLDYAANFFTTELGGNIYSVTPNCQVGYRLGLAKEWNCFSLGVSYTDFKPRYSSTTINTNLDLPYLIGSTRLSSFQDVSIVQYARGAYDVDLQIVDLEAAYHLSQTPRILADLFGGVKWASLNQSYRAQYYENLTDVGQPVVIGTINFLTQKTDFTAWGLYGGGYLEATPLWCFQIFGKFSAGVLVANMKRSINQSGSRGGTPPGDPEVSLTEVNDRIIGNLNGAAGVALPFFNYFKVSFGYEIDLWMNTSTFLSYYRETSGVGDTITRSANILGFDGFYLRLEALF